VVCVTGQPILDKLRSARRDPGIETPLETVDGWCQGIAPIQGVSHRLAGKINMNKDPSCRQNRIVRLGKLMLFRVTFVVT
jgi:hypothetical protein